MCLKQVLTKFMFIDLWISRKRNIPDFRSSYTIFSADLFMCRLWTSILLSNLLFFNKRKNKNYSSLGLKGKEGKMRVMLYRHRLLGLFMYGVYFWILGTFALFTFLFFTEHFLLRNGHSQIESPIVEHDWINGSPMPTPRTEISATILDGKIYVVGGKTKNEQTNIVEVYDPKLDKWSTDVSPLPIALDHSASDTYNGKIYLVGGFIEDGGSRHAINSLFIYDPVINKWKEGQPMLTSRAGLTAKFINGTLYAIGGSTGDNAGQVNLNEAYDPKSNTWTLREPMPTARHHITSQFIDTKLYVIGGRETGIPSSLDVNEIYDPKKDQWTTGEPMPTKRSSIASATIDGIIYVFGGEQEVGSFNKNEKYDIKSNKWSEDVPMPTARLGLEAIAHDNEIYVIGGKENQSEASATDIIEKFQINSTK